MGTIGADIVLKTLAEEGVEVIFGYPGANTLPLNDRLADSPIRHYLMRHEQAAAHAADGYARATGKVGVCLATSGPGATNLVTGIATAYMDSTPMVAITAQVNSDLWGRDAFQETDIIGITMPITKHSFMVRDVNQLAASLRQAFQLASTGRTGPVLVDIPRDILSAPCGEQPKKIPAAPPKRIEHPEQLERIAQALNRSERPVIIIGGGVKLGDACDLATEFVQTARVPFVTTMMGIGSVAYANGFNLGFIGTHGNELANRTVHQADFILALGTRFTERSTSVIEEFAPLATVAQIDIDSTSIGKNIKVDLPYEGEIQDAPGGADPADRSPRTGGLDGTDPCRARTPGGEAQGRRVRPGGEPDPQDPGRDAPGDDRGPGRGAEPDLDGPHLAEPFPPQPADERRHGDDGLLRSGRHRRQGGRPGPGRGRHLRRRRVLHEHPGAGDDQQPTACRSRSS